MATSLRDALLGAVAQAAQQFLDGMIPRLRKRLQEEIAYRIIHSPEYPALTYGQLWPELGTNEGDEVTERIIAALQSEMVVEPIPVQIAGNDIKGGFEAYVLRSDLRNVLGVPGAYFTSEKGHYIPWLEWLLKGGGGILITGWHYLENLHTRQFSRTNQGIMQKKRGGAWSVPSQYAGTEDDNWLTRALAGLELDVEDHLKAELG